MPTSIVSFTKPSSPRRRGLSTRPDPDAYVCLRVHPRDTVQEWLAASKWQSIDVAGLEYLWNIEDGEASFQPGFVGILQAEKTSHPGYVIVVQRCVVDRFRPYIGPQELWPIGVVLLCCNLQAVIHGIGNRRNVRPDGSKLRTGKVELKLLHRRAGEDTVGICNVTSQRIRHLVLQRRNLIQRIILDRRRQDIELVGAAEIDVGAVRCHKRLFEGGSSHDILGLPQASVALCRHSRTGTQGEPGNAIVG